VITQHTPETLIAFEDDIAAEFGAGRIRAPVHLSGGGEAELINIFQHVRPEDWVFTNWRSHYHCLLKGVPPEQLRKDILDGRSITLCYPEYRIFSSAIMGGSVSIALGAALSAKRNSSAERIWVFVGDMTAHTGAFAEASMYAAGHALPITFVIEDNGRSVTTDTERAWGSNRKVDVQAYQYVPKWPHSGIGKFVHF
jgi:pyruvate dehydrogenase E1 component alpha subunit